MFPFIPKLFIHRNGELIPLGPEPYTYRFIEANSGVAFHMKAEFVPGTVVVAYPFFSVAMDPIGIGILRESILGTHCPEEDVGTIGIHHFNGSDKIGEGLFSDEIVVALPLMTCPSGELIRGLESKSASQSSGRLICTSLFHLRCTSLPLKVKGISAVKMSKLT